MLKTKVTVPTALINREHWAQFEVNKLYKKVCLDRLEEKINYKFRDKSFIVQAVTHSSFRQNVTDCYQRLEFLGDAVLDFLVTCLVFSRHSQYSPGQVSDLRSHYVKNETLASVCVKAGLEKHMLHMADKLQTAIDKFLNRILEDSNMDDVNIEEDEVEWQDVDVPKALGDMVESIIGAVYLDSGRSLKTTWNVVVVLMGHVIEETMTDIPIDCVRKLFEEMPNKVEFIKVPREEDDDTAKYEVRVEGLPVLVGKGRNYRTAKMAAAKLALQKLTYVNLC
ncbi:hypothetical protein Pcinc_031533 [Petrolisthes cinctipes]|uniref:Uncharacterized protein n=1 Tax=Petrolisthes cinctipes TaxID=88211 RepID=A0AAE1EWE5_PETCI|nr:hypothetical protein Pcinc_031533 [Petrolisthes cinctipes]